MTTIAQVFITSLRRRATVQAVGVAIDGANTKSRLYAVIGCVT
jgi:hypothetical protein